MKGKLVKNNHFYALQIDSNIIAVSLDKETESHTVNYEHSLSLKNCQAIENGYDLDELATKSAKTCEDCDVYVFRAGHYDGFKDGFQKALEILGDKKFSEEQVLNAFYAGWISKDKLYLEAQKSYKGYLKRHVTQQTEWDVEIVMDRIPADLAPGGWDVFPKLDAENCLILKKAE
jgi:hypothetical protein